MADPFGVGGEVSNLSKACLFNSGELTAESLSYLTREKQCLAFAAGLKVAGAQCYLSDYEKLVTGMQVYWAPSAQIKTVRAVPLSAEQIQTMGALEGTWADAVAGMTRDGVNWRFGTPPLAVEPE